MFVDEQCHIHTGIQHLHTQKPKWHKSSSQYKKVLKSWVESKCHLARANMNNLYVQKGFNLIISCDWGDNFLIQTRICMLWIPAGVKTTAPSILTNLSQSKWKLKRKSEG